MKLPENNSHHFVPKGWGSEEWIVNNSEYCGKILNFTKGKKCSLHYHAKKDETFYVLSGCVEMWWTDDGLDYPDETLSAAKIEFLKKRSIKTILRTGDSFCVPRFRVHQVVALEDTRVIEFSTEHFDSDSYRIEKGD